MTRTATGGGSVWVERLPALGDAGIWVASVGGREVLQRDEVMAWFSAAEHVFKDRAEIATVSLAATDDADVQRVRDLHPRVSAVQAGAARLPICFLSGRVADLLGVRAAPDGENCPIETFQQWIEKATLKGLIHVWLLHDMPASVQVVSLPSRRTVPETAGDAGARLVAVDRSIADPARRSSMSVGIDAAWLLGGESGAQQFAVEMIKELARRPEIARIVMISETGGLPRSLNGVPKVGQVSWQDALMQAAPVVDIIHRPYQPAADVDYRRYHRVAKCVALTVLDFIAYDNPAYHESRWSWRQHQDAFDESVCLADGVFAISRYVGMRLERQFAHQLSGPVRVLPLGTDHLDLAAEGVTAADLGREVAALEATRFLLVLGNDFEHKNRDFAVTVFADMRDRGYTGHLVLAGFHLDGGSTFGHELSGAAHHADWIVRMRSVSAAEKAWLLRRAEAVLYPTSSEGFGLIPFEAAALGTPTAFVRFGPLRETLPGVEACEGWHVRAFADHVFRLMANPGAQIEQIRAAGAALTWKSHVDQLLDGYQDLLSDGRPWRTHARQQPGFRDRGSRTAVTYAYRAARKLRRLAGRFSRA